MKIAAYVTDTKTGKVLYVRTTTGLCWSNGKGDIGALIQMKIEGIKTHS